MLRIVAGELGGRTLRTPGGRDVRPTRESVREAWFSVLADRVVGARVLDLFAGSGALGFEALSRGAEEVHFVDADPRVLDVLTRNVEELGVADRTTIFRRDVGTFLDDLRRRGEEPYDVCLADPPYGSSGAEEVVDAWVHRPFGRLLCVEHAAEVTFDHPDVAWHRTYGDSGLTFFLTAHDIPGDASGGQRDAGAADRRREPADGGG